jgi:hypothetical protein
MLSFPLVDQLTGIALGADLAPLESGTTHVVACTHRLTRERSYSFLHALWWVWLADGRSAVSVPPGVQDGILGAVASVTTADEMLSPSTARRLRTIVDDGLRAHGLGATDRVIRSLWFACNRDLLRTHRHGKLVRIVDDCTPAAPGIRMPKHCFPGAEGPSDPGGIVYGVEAEGRIASVAYAHRSGILEDKVADLAVETAEPYRRRGYAQTAVSAVVGVLAAAGGEARYACAPDNLASQSTARSVGFVPYATVLVLAAPWEGA